MTTTNDYGSFFNSGLNAADPDMVRLIDLERERQIGKLILIASESICPPAVLSALNTPLNNIYAEGLPHHLLSGRERGRILDHARRMTHFRRYGDRRFYRGCDYVDLVEGLACLRVAELFANEQVAAESIFANVQPLSGAAANNAVYEAFVPPGGKVMGLDLTCGGHLTHGNPANRSGRNYEVLSYGLNRKTGQLDYDGIKALAGKVKPHLLIAGFSAYPWDIDWARMREAADASGGHCVLLADISHTAGLIAAKVLNNPIGHAQVISFTTHKTLCGPRGAVILTTDEERAHQVDLGVFPGEQGGPHMHQIAAKAVAFQLAGTGAFRELAAGIVDNAKALAAGFEKRGLKLAYGGTNTHLCLLDLKSVKGPTGRPLTGEIASRILDVCGLVTNKNTIAGDDNAVHPTGLRFGTTWATQRGLGPGDMDALSDIVAELLTSIHAFSYPGARRDTGRGRLPLPVIQKTRGRMNGLLEKAAAFHQAPTTDYPFWPEGPVARDAALMITGQSGRVRGMLQEIGSANLSEMEVGEYRDTFLLEPDGALLARARIRREESDDGEQECYLLSCSAGRAPSVAAWLRALSDGYVLSFPEDIWAKVQGPFELFPAQPKDLEAPPEEAPAAGTQAAVLHEEFPLLFDLTTPPFVGGADLRARFATGVIREFKPPAPSTTLQRTCLYEDHLRLTRKSNIVPFAGWEMPVRYGSLLEEHRTVRQAAGLFDVSHMGVMEARGQGAERFLDLVSTAYLPLLRPGQSIYSYLLAPDGQPIDDIIIYRRGWRKFLIVVNAANAEKDLAWLQAVARREVTIDTAHPQCMVDMVDLELRDLKDPAAGMEQLVDLAFQGPASLPVLMQLLSGDGDKAKLAALRRNELFDATLAGHRVVISRTGYTGEELGFELFVHPEAAPALWRAILETGEKAGVKPAGLAARDSTRTEAGLPLYGHELAGELGITPLEAGYAAFIKLHKPFFIGRAKTIENMNKQTTTIVRFKVDSAGTRPLRPKSPVATTRGQVVGQVTSCTFIDENRQVGMALIDRRQSQEGSALVVLPLPDPRRLPVAKAYDRLSPGDGILLHEPITLMARFPGPGEMAIAQPGAPW